MRETSVLIVDDNEDCRGLVRLALEQEGFAARVACEGQEALAKLKESPNSRCLVLLDLMMPGMSGWEFVKVMRGDPLLRDNPIVATTAVPEDAPCGVDAVLQKPFDLEKLVSMVARYCSREPIAPQAAAPAPPW
jgi:CheY-like chemotaxis protein